MDRCDEQPCDGNACGNGAWAAGSVVDAVGSSEWLVLGSFAFGVLVAALWGVVARWTARRLAPVGWRVWRPRRRLPELNSSSSIEAVGEAGSEMQMESPQGRQGQLSYTRH